MNKIRFRGDKRIKKNLIFNDFRCKIKSSVDIDYNKFLMILKRNQYKTILKMLIYNAGIKYIKSGDDSENDLKINKRN